MKNVLIIIIILIFIYYLASENFSGYNCIKLYDRFQYATYSAMDGRFLNLTFRNPVRRIDYDLTHGPYYCELWGYNGNGIPEAEDTGNLYENPNWTLILRMKDTHQKNTIFLKHIYPAYHISIVF